MTTKDSVAVLDARSGTAPPLRRGDAVGAEIPVTVHASRTNQDLSQNLPPVDEETRTVIVFPQGAVVRLTASLTPGETVVLTNRMTEADVLCRVSSVKTQPGIQHYVDLEFTQRAPGFWGQSVPVPSAAVLETPSAAPTPRVPPAVATAPPAPAVPEPPVVAAPAPIANQHSAAQPLKFAPLAESVSAPRPGPQAHQAHSVRPIRPAAASRVSTDAAPGGKAPRLLAEEPLGAGGAPGASWGSKKGVLVATASILLAVGAAIGGYWFYRQGRMLPDAPAPQQTVNVPQSQVEPPILPEAIFPADDPTAAALNPAPLPEAQTDIIIESRPPVERPVNSVQPPPVAAARAPLPAVRRNSLAIGKLPTPVMKTMLSTPVSSEAPPVLDGAVNALVDSGMANTLLAGTGTDAAPPPPSSRPALGGQLQPPQLISSTPPAYPARARAQRVQGVVVLDALVDETGKVVETTVITGPLSLQSAAQEALRNWRYQPARLNGQPIPVHTRVNVRFSLN